MLVDFLKEMIKEKIYYKKVDDVIEIWQEKEKISNKPYFIIKLLGSDKKLKEKINVKERRNYDNVRSDE